MFSALRNRDYQLYWFGAFISFTGNWVQSICHGWLVYEITKSPFWLGLIGFIGNAPLFALTFVGGAVADKVDKRRALLITQSLFGLSALLLGILVVRGEATRYNIAAIAFFNGIVMAIDSPMRQSIPVQIVGKKDLANAISLNSAAFNSARIIGPGLAGLLISQLSNHIGKQHAMAWCFYINAISYAAVIGALLLMKVRTPPTNEDSVSIVSDLKAGLTYIRSQRTIATLICMGVIPSLFVMPYPSMMLIISKDILKAGVVGYSSMMMATGVGALIGALSLAHRSSNGRRGMVLLSAAVFDAVMLILVASSRSLLLTRLLMVGVGFMTVTFNAMMNTLIQSLSSDKFRGRVVSANIFTMMGLSPLASLQAGTVAHMWGAPATLTIGGLLFAGMAIFVFLTRKDIRDL